MAKHLGFGPLFEDPMAIRCRKSARRCGAKHISKSKVSKTEGFGRLGVKSYNNENNVYMSASKHVSDILVTLIVLGGRNFV